MLTHMNFLVVAADADVAAGSHAAAGSLAYYQSALGSLP
jgi:hypothetical protein